MGVARSLGTCQTADVPSAAASTCQLLDRAREGDAGALDDLFTRQLPVLRRWAKGRLPSWARDTTDTQDLVQDTAIQALKHVHTFQVRGPGSLQAYLRQAVKNRILNEFRRVDRHPHGESLDERTPAAATSPLDLAIRGEQRRRYEAALLRLTDVERELVTGRLDLGLSYEELAAKTGKPSWNAARMATARALLRLARELQRA